MAKQRKQKESLKGEVLLYRADDGLPAVEVVLDRETVWLTQAQLVRLFRRNQSVISRHIGNVFNEGELSPKSNMQKMHIANSDKPVVFYNLDLIISVGYRVKSREGVRFRQWATGVLKEHLIRGRGHADVANMNCIVSGLIERVFHSRRQAVVDEKPHHPA